MQYYDQLHTGYYKKTEKVSTNVEFEPPTKNGRKLAGLKKVGVMRQKYINGVGKGVKQ